MCQYIHVPDSQCSCPVKSSSSLTPVCRPQAFPQENQRNSATAAVLLNELQRLHKRQTAHSKACYRIDNSLVVYRGSVYVAFSDRARFPTREIAPYACLAVKRAYVGFFPLFHKYSPTEVDVRRATLLFFQYTTSILYIFENGVNVTHLIQREKDDIVMLSIFRDLRWEGWF